MKRYGRASLAEFLGDFVVYRNIHPFDKRLPSLSDLSGDLGLAPGAVPRKTSSEYARLLAMILQTAQSMDNPGTQIERVVLVGDTLMNDGTAFRNICQAGGWHGLGFIGSESQDPNKIQLEQHTGTIIYIANRWSALEDFNTFCQQKDFRVDQHTVVLVDIDKTALGARGRNDAVIDQVRMDAALETASRLLAQEYDSRAFKESYQHLNQPEFHSFTTDNQDYLVYICLILASDSYNLNSLVDAVRTGVLTSFDQFIAGVEEGKNNLPANLKALHEDIYARVRQGDPTPFKDFRRNEYLATAARMGQMGETAALSDLLSQEILITQEIRKMALQWRGQGALLFGLSDKPDEASTPTSELAAQGYLPIHQIETDIVGE